MPTVYRVNDAEDKTRYIAVADSGGEFLLVQCEPDITDVEAFALLTEKDVVSELLFSVSGHSWAYFEAWLNDDGEDGAGVGPVTLIEIGQVPYAAW